MLRLMLFALSDGGSGGTGEEEHEDGNDFTHQDFLTMSLRDVEKISGVARPVNRTPEDHKEYREKAWHSYQQDISNRNEWGNARQGDEDDDPPVREDEEPV